MESTESPLRQAGHQPGVTSPASCVLGRIARMQVNPADAEMPLRPSVQPALQQIKATVLATIVEGQSNSVLIVGPHGCGKSAVRTLAPLPPLPPTVA
jgi:ABC-type uncharacterized transport system fused permease/ATPase subunit